MLSQIELADQTPFFYMPLNYTVGSVGEKNIRLLTKTTFFHYRGWEQITTLYFLKRKTLPNKENFLENTNVRIKRNDLMMGNLVQNCLKKVWFRRQMWLYSS